MIGDKINIKDDYLITATEIFHYLNDQLKHAKKFVIGIGGESGSGKSVTALCLQKVLNQEGFKTQIIHQDDYFIYPPKTNHEKRVADFNHIGFQEIDFFLLRKNIVDFKQNKPQITKPLVDYPANTIGSETLDFLDVEILIIEGTYILALDNLDVTIFIDRNFKDTYQQRKNRGREEMDAFIEKVLEKEHQLIYPFHLQSDIIITKDYSVITNK